MYHLEALHNMHVNENVFTRENLLKDVGSILLDQKKLRFLSGNARTI